MLSFIKRLAGGEKKLIIFFSLIIIFFSAAPFAYFYSQKPAGWDFYLTASTHYSDSYIYLQYLTQIKEGGWLIYDNLTLEQPQPGVLNIVWLANGLLARFFNLRVDIAYHLFSLAMTPVALLSLYFLLKTYEDNFRKNILRMSLIAFGFGVGLFFAIFYQTANNPGPVIDMPIDIWQVEGSLWQSIMHSPNFTLSWACLFLTVAFLIRFFRTGNLHDVAWAGLVSLVWFNFHPYYAPFTFALIFFAGIAAWLVKKMSLDIMLKGWLIYGALTVPSLLYAFYMTYLDPFLSVRNAQNYTPTSPPETIIFGFGFLLLLAVPAVIRKVRTSEKTAVDWLLIIWVCLVPILIYLPFSFQRRLIMGWSVPLAIFTVEQIEFMLMKYKHDIGLIFRQAPASIFIFILVFGSNIPTYFASEYARLMETESLQHHYLASAPHDLSLAIEFLKENNPQRAPIIGEFRNMIMANAFADQRVYCCGKHETINYHQREMIFSQFHTSQNFDRDGFLAENRIRYIVSEKPDARFSEVYDEVFSSGDFRVYDTGY